VCSDTKIKKTWTGSRTKQTDLKQIEARGRERQEHVKYREIKSEEEKKGEWKGISTIMKYENRELRKCENREE
jgi:hypothetical protein